MSIHFLAPYFSLRTLLEVPDQADPLEGKHVMTRAGYLLPAITSRDAIDMLRNLTDSGNIRRETWSILCNMQRGEEIPYDAIAYTSTFDEVIGEHCFFDGDRMDPRSYSFFADVLFVQGRRGIVLDSSYYDAQFRALENAATASRPHQAAAYQLR